MTHSFCPRHPGGTYYLTAHLADRSSTLLTDQIDRLRDATRQTIARYPFQIDAVAVLPNAIHSIWTLPRGDSNMSLRWSMLKSRFSKALPTQDKRACAQRYQGTSDIWQHGHSKHLIRDPADYEAHLQMIHASPVRSGLCTLPQEWAHSSVHRFLLQQRDAPKIKAIGASKPAVEPILARTYREEEFSHHP